MSIGYFQLQSRNHFAQLHQVLDCIKADTHTGQMIDCLRKSFVVDYFADYVTVVFGLRFE